MVLSVSDADVNVAAELLNIPNTSATVKSDGVALLPLLFPLSVLDAIVARLLLVTLVVPKAVVPSFDIVIAPDILRGIYAVPFEISNCASVAAVADISLRFVVAKFTLLAEVN